MVFQKRYLRYTHGAKIVFYRFAELHLTHDILVYSTNMLVKHPLRVRNGFDAAEELFTKGIRRYDALRILHLGLTTSLYYHFPQEELCYRYPSEYLPPRRGLAEAIRGVNLP